MDAVEKAIWNDVEKHSNGCWTWTGPNGCSIVRLLAELSGYPLPANRRMYRMPECELGAECVNPEHVGTAEEWAEAIRKARRARLDTGSETGRNRLGTPTSSTTVAATLLLNSS